MKKIFISILLLCVQYVAFSQEAKSCSEYNSESMKAYYAKDYQLAVQLFQKALKNNCSKDFRADDFYNAACSASLNKDKKLTFVYLNQAIEYASFINKLTNNDKKTLALFKKLKKEDIDNAIPYVENGKWGWLHRNTLKPLTKAVFEYTDFRTAKGLLFTYKGRKNYYTGVTEIPNNEPIPEPPMGIEPMGFDDAPQLVDMARSEPSEEERLEKPESGFILKRGTITSFSDQYKSVELISQRYSSTQMAIATNQEGKKGIIYENDDILSIFDFSYSHIDYFLANYKPPFFVAKKFGSNEAWIYNIGGKKVHNEAISNSIDFDPFQRTPLHDNVYIGNRPYQKYLGVYKAGKGFNILKKEEEFKSIFPTYYDKFIFVNGSTDKDNKSNLVDNELSEIFFFVKKGDKSFYVDEQGKEYQVKK
jgi:hypothetical protein